MCTSQEQGNWVAKAAFACTADAVQNILSKGKRLGKRGTSDQERNWSPKLFSSLFPRAKNANSFALLGFTYARQSQNQTVSNLKSWYGIKQALIKTQQRNTYLLTFMGVFGFVVVPRFLDGDTLPTWIWHTSSKRGSFGRTTCFRIFDTCLPLKDMVPNVWGIHAWRNE